MKKIIIFSVCFIIGFICFFGVEDLLGLPPKEEKILKYKITCKENVYIVDNDQWDIRYKGYAKKILIINYNNKIINCETDYFVKEIYVTKGKE